MNVCVFTSQVHRFRSLMQNSKLSWGGSSALETGAKSQWKHINTSTCQKHFNPFLCNQDRKKSRTCVFFFWGGGSGKRHVFSVASLLPPYATEARIMLTHSTHALDTRTSGILVKIYKLHRSKTQKKKKNPKQSKTKNPAPNSKPKPN